MRKIPSLFLRDRMGGTIINEVTPGCEWVQAGEGVATVKLDGTSCMVRGGRLFKRFDRKNGKPGPAGWEPCQDAPDEHTGHWPGWVLVGDDPGDRWHREACAEAETLPDGTYELLGPRVQGNPYRRDETSKHFLEPHGRVRFKDDPPRTFVELAEWFKTTEPVEGIVWHHPNGRMVKIKRRDFGLPWPDVSIPSLEVVAALLKKLYPPNSLECLIYKDRE